MAALKAPLVFACILFFFTFPVIGQESTDGPYPTGEYPVETGYGDSCSACCKEKIVDGKIYYLVDYYDPPPYGCNSGCIYQEADTGVRVCFGPGEYQPECIAVQNYTHTGPFQHPFTTVSNLNDSDPECTSFFITTGPYGGNGGSFQTDEGFFAGSNFIAQIFLSKGTFDNQEVITSFQEQFGAITLGNTFGIPTSATNNIGVSGKITSVQGFTGTYVNGLSFTIDGNVGTNFGGSQGTRFSQDQPCPGLQPDKGGRLAFISGSSGVVLDSLYLHWQCCLPCPPAQK